MRYGTIIQFCKKNAYGSWKRVKFPPMRFERFERLYGISSTTLSCFITINLLKNINFNKHSQTAFELISCIDSLRGWFVTFYSFNIILNEVTSETQGGFRISNCNGPPLKSFKRLSKLDRLRFNEPQYRTDINGAGSYTVIERFGCRSSFQGSNPNRGQHFLKRRWQSLCVDEPERSGEVFRYLLFNCSARSATDCQISRSAFHLSFRHLFTI